MITTPPARPLVIVQTGTMSRPRREISSTIAAAGHIPQDNFSKQTDLLVMATADQGSSKALKAAQNGIRTIDEASLYEFLRDCNKDNGFQARGFFNPLGKYATQFVRTRADGRVREWARDVENEPATPRRAAPTTLAPLRRFR